MLALANSLKVIQLQHFGKIREQLEASYNLHEQLLASEELPAITKLLAEVSTSNDLLSNAQKLDEVSELTLGFEKQYCRYIRPDLYIKIKTLAEESKRDGKLYRGLSLLIEANKTENLVLQFEQLTTGFKIIAEVIDDYWISFTPEIQNSLSSLAANNMTKFASMPKYDNWAGDKKLVDKYIKMLQSYVSFIAWRIDEFEKEKQLEANELSFGEQANPERTMFSSLKHKGRNEAEQLEKNQPAIATAKIWLEERDRALNLCLTTTSLNEPRSLTPLYLGLKTSDS